MGITPVYGSSVALTITHLNGLTVSSLGLDCWSSAVVDNSSNLSMDEVVSYVISFSNTSGGGTICEWWLWEVMDDTPTYPDTISGAEGTFTLTSGNVKCGGAFKQALTFALDGTTSRKYYGTFRLSSCFGPTPPKKWGVMFVNNVGTVSSSGNAVTRTPIQYVKP